MLTFSTLRSRLLLLIALALLPAVVLAATLSWRVYRTTEKFALEAYRQAAVAAGGRGRVVIHGGVGVLRSLAAVELPLDGEACRQALRRVVEANDSLRAVGLIGRNGLVCAGGQEGSFDGFDRAALLAPLAQGSAQAYNAVVGQRKGRSLLAVSAPAAKDDQVLAVIFRPDWLDQVMADITPIEDGTVAIFDEAQHMLVVQGKDEAVDGWLPAKPLARAGLPADIGLTRAASRDGRDFIYVSTSVLAGKLDVLAGFPASVFGVAERQLLFGTFSPFVLSAIVLIVAWLAIERLVLRWVRSLNRQVRRLASGDFGARAMMPVEAPLELRQYAEAFNHMTEVLGTRSQELAQVAQQRSGLMRELHHRVKNNFQVIASFLNLMRRQPSRESREQALAFAECRVHAMAAAYKLALAQGDIRHVAVAALVPDVVAYALQAAGRPVEAVVLNIREGVGFLHLDRAIPLALLVVETLWPLLSSPRQPRLTVDVYPGDGAGVSVTIGSDQVAAQGPAPSRFTRAFMQQIEATAVPDAGSGTVLAIRLPVEASG